MGVTMLPLTHYMYAEVDHPHQLTSENYEQTDTIQILTKNTAQSICEGTVLEYQKRHETMEMLLVAMAVTAPALKLKTNMHALEEVGLPEISENIEMIQ